LPVYWECIFIENGASEILYADLKSYFHGKHVQSCIVHFLSHIFNLLGGTCSPSLTLHPFILLFYYITALILHRKPTDVCSVTVLHTYRSHLVSCGTHQARIFMHYCTYNEYISMYSLYINICTNIHLYT
jgi:hypothetical protein